MVCIVLMFCAAAVIASPAQTLTTLHSFAGAPSDGNTANAALVQGSNGNFYGTTVKGGNSASICQDGCGTVFEVTPAGTLTVLYNFCVKYPCADGIAPYAALVQGTDGNFYGTAYSGGKFNSGGTVFKITPAGALTALYNFCSQTNCADGRQPYAGLVLGTDGNFYGTTLEGGASDHGTVFKITPGGTLTTLYSFCSQTNCVDGIGPYAGLVQATDGNFYGTTYEGGAVDYGTVFKITPAGTLTTLYSFCSLANCVDGYIPYGTLVQGSDGNFYGTTTQGAGTYGNGGTVFKITPAGALTTLYSFCSQQNCTDGDDPIAGLVQASDGNFYGTTQQAGGTNCANNPNHCGTVFKITPAGELTTLYRFDYSDGKWPIAGLVQASDGNFYGTTYTGGANGLGTVYKLSGATSPSPLQFVPVPPCRLVDTRTQSGGGGPIPGGSFETFILPNLAESGKFCPAFSLASAAAYSLNVSVVPPGPLGYLTIWPAGRTRPLVSTMNSVDGRVKANAAIVPAGASAAVNVFVSNTTDVVLDIDGYFTTASGSTLAFYPLAPCRIADTRNPNGPLGGPSLQGGVERDFPVQSNPNCVIPSTALAYSFNFTAVPVGGQPLGYLTVWPTGQTQPVVSTLNDLTGTVVANAAIVPAGQPNGEVAVFPSNPTDLVIDVNGYFAPPGAGGLSLYPVVPCRVLDTRNGNGAFSGTLNPPVDVVDSACAPPGTAQAYVFNATVVPSGPLGYLTLWPDDGSPPPVVATLNAVDGAVTSNMAIVPTTNGKINAFASNLTQLILDISSYFAP
jgi:uncharacterized repeat protein (TIGR03803 family)